MSVVVKYNTDKRIKHNKSRLYILCKDRYLIKEFKENKFKFFVNSNNIMYTANGIIISRGWQSDSKRLKSFINKIISVDTDIIVIADSICLSELSGVHLIYYMGNGIKHYVSVGNNKYEIIKNSVIYDIDNWIKTSEVIKLDSVEKEHLRGFRI